jgi:hypothetical protein
MKTMTIMVHKANPSQIHLIRRINETNEAFLKKRLDIQGSKRLDTKGPLLTWPFALCV